MPIDLAVNASSAIPHGDIAAVRLIAALDGRPLFCSCERRGAERAVHWRMSGPRSAVHDHPLGFRDEGWVLGKAIDSVEADPVYRAAVLAAAEWARFAEEAR
jgi:hypothetical protein